MGKLIGYEGEFAILSSTGCGGRSTAIPPARVTASKYTFGRKAAGTSHTPVCACSR